MEEFIPFEFSEYDDLQLIYSLLSSLEYLSNIGTNMTNYCPQFMDHNNPYIEEFHDKFENQSYEVRKSLIESYLRYIDTAALELEHIFNDAKLFCDTNFYMMSNQKDFFIWNAANKHGIIINDEICDSQSGIGFPPYKDKKRGHLPSSAIKILRSWLEKRVDNPYPTDKEKEYLIETTGITAGQLCNWFINARRRILPKLIQQQKRNSREKSKKREDEEYKVLHNNKKRRKKGKSSDDEFICMSE